MNIGDLISQNFLNSKKGCLHEEKSLYGNYNLTMSHYQMKTSSLDHIKPNTLFAAKSMTANGVTV
jgi:hypothetical protein